MSVRQIQADIDNMYTSTWQEIRPEKIDNVFKSTPFLDFLTQKGRVKQIVGGRNIETPLEYADSSSAASWFGKTHDLSSDVTAAKSVEILTTAVVEWRYIAASLYRFWVDDAKNRGKAALFSLVETKLNNAEKTLKKLLTTGLFGLNDPDNDDKIEGLQNWVRDVPNPAYASRYTQGGIAQGEIGSGSGTYNHTWWNNQTKNMTGLDLTVNLVPEMINMFNTCSDGMDTPDIIVTTQALYEAYEQETMEYKSIVNQNKGDATFESVLFKGKPLIWDNQAPSAKMYFLNSEYLYLIGDQDIWFEMTAWKEGKTDLDRVSQIICALNLSCSNRSRQGVIYNAS